MFTAAERCPGPARIRHTIPGLRCAPARPRGKKEGGGFVNWEEGCLFPEITLLASDSPDPSRTTFLVRPIGDTIDFALVRNWLAICEKQHGQDCNRSAFREHEFTNPVDEIPGLRFIDVIDHCIVNARDVATSNAVRFATLSYVWGRVPTLRMLKSNIDMLSEQGSLQRPELYNRLPWTTRDAIQVVRELGLRYLWVDTLCIVQDDPVEKIETIRKMDIVYGTAFVTIVAATGDNANVGLPGVRPGTRRIRQPIEEIAPGFRLAFKQRHLDYLKSSPYFTRGWTYVFF